MLLKTISVPFRLISGIFFLSRYQQKFRIFLLRPRSTSLLDTGTEGCSQLPSSLGKMQVKVRQKPNFTKNSFESLTAYATLARTSIPGPSAGCSCPVAPCSLPPTRRSACQTRDRVNVPFSRDRHS